MCLHMFTTLCMLGIMSEHGRVHKRRRISDIQRGAAVALHKRGLTVREIEKETGVSRSSVQRLVKKHRQGAPLQAGKKTGRPLLSTTRQDRVLKRIVRGSPDKRRKTRSEIAHEWRSATGINASPWTISGRLKKLGFKSRVAAKKPFTSPANIAQRVLWCKEHRGWTLEQWETVLWSDETSVQLHPTRPKRVWRTKNERLQPDCQNPTIKHGGGSIQVWGCFSASGIGGLHLIEGIMDRHVYRDILEDSMLPILRESGASIFQQDNSRVHTAKLCTEFLSSCEAVKEVMDWPSQSPDLNPIEHVWDHVKRQLNAENLSRGYPANREELWERISRVWVALEPDYFRGLVHSMPRRIAAVIKNRGHPTRY